MKKLLFFVIVCATIISIFALSVLADSIISKAVYSDSEIYYEGSRLEFSNPPVLVVEQDEDSAKTYVPVREFFESMGYNVAWQGEDRSIHISPPADTSSGAPMTSKFLAEADGARLYLISSGERGNPHAMLTYGAAVETFDWAVLSPRMQYPEIFVRDVDSDGDDEIVIITWPVSGTGVFFNELHVIEIIRDNGEAVDFEAFEFDNYLDYIDSVVALEAVQSDGKTLLNAKCGDQVVTAELEASLTSDTITQVNMRGGTWICDITQNDDGTFHIEMPLAVQTEYVVPELVATFKADFTYKGGGFELTNPLIAPLAE